MPFFNVGGGIKTRLKGKLGIRAEFRYYSAEDTSESGIFGGISYFF